MEKHQKAKMFKKTKNKLFLDQLKKLYHTKKKEIRSRLKAFETVWAESSDEDIFTELAFCILTPQSKAMLCWDAIIKLKENNILFQGTVEQTKPYVICARFKNKKAHYLVEARKLFMLDGTISIRSRLSTFDSSYECRDWLVHNIRGLGYKEASHFLRNIGFGENIAILDRHILRNLATLRLIEDIPNSMSRRKYLHIEEIMSGFAKQIQIPLSHLDLLFWYKETGKIFK